MRAQTDRARRAEGVLALHDAIAQGSALQEVQALAVSEVARQLGGAAALWFADADGLRLACFDHPDPRARADMERLTLGLVHGRDSFAQQVMRAGVPLSLTGGEVVAMLPLMEAAYRTYFATHGVSCMLLQPMRCQGRDVGLLGVSRDGGQPPFQPPDAEQVERMGRILSVALDSARALAGARAAQGELARLALTDPLTGLPNRRAFFDAPCDSSLWTGLLLLDLDKFKQVNDGLGHRAGDMVLSAFADHLRTVAGLSVFVARLGGDEFVALLQSPRRDALRDEALTLAGKAETAMSLSDLQVGVRASAGFVDSPPGESCDMLALLQRADLAMYRAKRLKLGHAEYDPLLDASASERLRDVAALREAVLGDGLVLHYQRCMPAAGGPAGGRYRQGRAPERFEALVRWVRDGVLVPPAAFLPLAAEMDLMPELTDVVLSQALAQLVRWREQGRRDIQVAVNVPASALTTAGFPARVDEQVRACALPRGALRLEVTEEEFVDESAREALLACQRLGIAVEMDDLGTGFSSLEALLTVPVSGIKLDRSLVSGVGVEPRRRVLVEHLVGLAHDLGMEVVGEGVETEADLDALVAAGVDYLQGFLLHRPGPASRAFEAERAALLP